MIIATFFPENLAEKVKNELLYGNQRYVWMRSMCTKHLRV